MLFNSLVPQVFKQMAGELYSTANTQRKQETAKRVDFYHGEHAEYLEEQLDSLFSDPDSMVKAHLNVVRKIVNSLSQTYRNPPLRILEGGTDRDQELYREISEECSQDLKLKQASRFTKLLKTILLRPVWRNGKLDLDILTGDILDVVTGSTPEDLREVLITDYGTSGKIEDLTFHHWTPEEYRLLDHNGGVLDTAPNPYRILPFLGVFDYPPTGSSFWLSGMSDLISIQESINLKLVDLLHLLSTQSFGVGYIKGSQGGANLRVDPGSLVELPPEGEIGFESQKAEIEQVVEAIDKLVKWACVSQGLSAASMSTDITDRQSGEAKRVDRVELEELRVDDVALWRNYEKQLFHLMRVVWNTHNPTKMLSESCSLSLDFSDPKAPADPVSQAQAWDLQISLGVLSAVDCAMALNPDISSREEALAHLLKIKEEMRELQSQ